MDLDFFVKNDRFRVSGGRHLYLIGSWFELLVGADLAVAEIFDDRLAINKDVDVRCVRREVGDAERTHLAVLLSRCLCSVFLFATTIILLCAASQSTDDNDCARCLENVSAS